MWPDVILAGYLQSSCNSRCQVECTPCKLIDITLAINNERSLILPNNIHLKSSYKSLKEHHFLLFSRNQKGYYKAVSRQLLGVQMCDLYPYLYIFPRVPLVCLSVDHPCSLNCLTYEHGIWHGYWYWYKIANFSTGGGFGCGRVFRKKTVLIDSLPIFIGSLPNEQRSHELDIVACLRGGVSIKPSHKGPQLPKALIHEWTSLSPNRNL